MPVWDNWIGTKRGSPAPGKLLRCVDNNGNGEWGDALDIGASFKNLGAGAAALLSTDGVTKYALGSSVKVPDNTLGTVVPIIFVSAGIPSGVPIRIAYGIDVNNTAPGRSVDLTLRDYTLNGAANQIKYVLGSAVSGLTQTVASGALTANGKASGVGPSLTSGLAAGNYILCFEPSGALTAGSLLSITMGLQVQYL